MNTMVRYVWLVDDDEEDIMLFREAFNQVAPQVQVRALTDGKELLPELQGTQLSPNLILLDLNMPHMGGFDALATLRAERGYRDLPVVVLTTSSNPADKQLSNILGANGFLTKPDTFADMTLLARQLVGQWLSADTCGQAIC